MSSLLFFVVSTLVWALFSRRLTRWSITAPIVMTAAGLLASRILNGGGSNLDSESIRALIEITLSVVLFVDASSIAVGWFRTSWRFPARLLGIGLPLTILLGIGVAALMFPGTDIWLLAVVGAALAPTDAALGVSIIENERIPLWFRQVINVESGLNDGLVTPVVSFCIAGAAAALGLTGHPVGAALVEIAVGVALGLGIGLGAGRALRWAVARDFAADAFVAVAPLVVAVATYMLVVEVGGNGFVAAFVCGMGFGTAWHPRADNRDAEVNAGGSATSREPVEFTHLTATLLGLAVWFVFGEFVLGALHPENVGRVVLYAVLSLTVLRMVPVAISLVGMRLPWDTVLLAGWLGPRGLASVIFAILAADTLAGSGGEVVLSIVGVTVALSVVAHGLSAGPLAAWYATRHPVDEPSPAVDSPSDR